VSHEITGSKQAKVDEPVLVTQTELAEGVQYEVIGTVNARARSGYSNAKTLFPLLADEARKIGANAVVGVEGGRHVSFFSWAAPHASGTAVRVDDPQALEASRG
jgi:uncharacterized protein YbjQ (UPF0145 family)